MPTSPCVRLGLACALMLASPCGAFGAHTMSSGAFRPTSMQAAALRACCPRAGAEEEKARLNSIFSACSRGRSITREETDAIREVGGRRADRYGEITQRGFTTLASRLRLGPSDVFADCGSGTGACVLQSVEEFDVARAVGVEFARSRHAVAVDDLALLPEPLSRRVTLSCGDAAAEHEWAPGGALHEVSVVWMCSELFNDELMQRLASRITASGSVRACATLRKFPDGLDGFRRHVLPERCEMSWTAALTNPEALGIHDEQGGAPVHIYVRE